MNGKPNFFKKKNTGNARVKNATKQHKYGLDFDSKLELFCYDLLRHYNIQFEFKKGFILQESFIFGTERIQAIKMSIDFYLPKQDILIDTKGFQTDKNILKMKMLKHYLARQGKYPKIELPKSQKEVRSLVERIAQVPKLL